MSHNKYPEQRVTLTKRGKLAAGAAALAIAVGGGVAINKHEANDLEQERLAAVETSSQVDGVTVLLDSGSTLRLTPQRIEDGSDGSTNAAFRVPEGEQLLATNPIISADGDWRGIVDPRVENGGPADVVWFQEKYLADQGYATVVGTSDKNVTYSFKIVDNELVSSGFNSPVEVGHAELGPDGSFNALLPVRQ